MKLFLPFSFVLFLITLFVGCDFTDNKNSDDDITSSITISESEADVTSPIIISESETDVTSPTIISESETTVSELAHSPDNGIQVLIKSNLEILAEDDPSVTFDETGSLDNELFNEIVALGEDALPYLEILVDKTQKNIDWFPNLEFEHQIWAVHAIYTIKPETYDLSFVSPDNKYTAKVIVDSFLSFFNHGQSFNDIHIIENATNELVYKTDMSNAFTAGGLFYCTVSWSTDSRFAVIDCCGRRSGSAMAIDMQTKSHILLPGAEEMINHVFPGEDINIVVPRVWFCPESWENEKIVKIEFIVSVIVDDKDFSGWYTYDLTKNKILKIEYSFFNNQ